MIPGQYRAERAIDAIRKDNLHVLLSELDLADAIEKRQLLDVAISRDASTKIVQGLLESGIEVDSLLADTSAFELACKLEHVRLAKLLLAHGANIDGAPRKSPDRQCETPLMLACAYGRVSTVDWLLKNGASQTVRDQFGSTAMRYALINLPERFWARCHQAGADLNAQDDRGDSLLCQMCSLQTASEDKVFTQLHWLLSRGADTTLTNNNGETVADKAKALNWNKALKLLADHQAFALSVASPHQTASTTRPRL